MVSVILALLAYLLVLAISNDNQKSFDLTSDGRHSFSQQTLDLMGKLDFEVKVYAFADPAGGSGQIEELLDRYRRLNKNFTFKMVDLDKEPTLATSLDVRAYGQGVVERVGSAPDKDGKPRRERILAFDEASITNAILKLSNLEAKKVAFLTGHGERAFVGGAKDSLSTLAANLTTEGFKAEALKLAESKTVPADVTLLVVAGPTSALPAGEQAALDDYLSKGGKMLFLAEVQTPLSYSEWLKRYGFELKNEVIIDPAAKIADQEPVFAIGQDYSPQTHPITKSFADYTGFRLSRPVDVTTADPIDGGGAPQLEVLVRTAKTAFVLPIAEVLKGEVALDINPEKASQQPLAAAGLYPRGEDPAADASATPGASPTPEAKVEISTRIVVVGNTEAFTDSLFAFVSNRDFVLNSINWLAQSENQITVRTRDPKAQPLMLDKQKENWMSFLFGWLLPFLCILTGVLIGYGRRKGMAS